MPEDPSTPRRIGCLLAAVIGTLVLLVLAVAGVCVYVLANSGDEPPPDVEDLMPERREVAVDGNGFRFIAARVSQDTSKKAPVDTTKEGDAEEWDPNVAIRILTAEKARLDAFDRCLAAPEFQVRQPSGPSPLRYLHVARSLVDLACLRAKVLSYQGKHTEAIEAALAVVRFGQRFESGGERLVDYNEGIKIKLGGLRVLREMVRKGDLEPRPLVVVIEELSRYAPDERGYGEVAKREFQEYASVIDDVSVGRRTLGDLLGGPIGWERLRTSRFQLKPNRTKRLYAEALRKRIAALSTITSERPRTAPILQAEPSLMTPGSVGDWLAELPWDSWDRILIQSSLERASLGATRIAIGARRFQLEKGRLPSTLAELVPEYLAAVPQDPFDGKALRYSAERKLVWSAGADLVDAGGQGRSPDDPDEPTFAIE